MLDHVAHLRAVAHFQVGAGLHGRVVASDLELWHVLERDHHSLRRAREEQRHEQGAQHPCLRSGLGLQAPAGHHAHRSCAADQVGGQETDQDRYDQHGAQREQTDSAQDQHVPVPGAESVGRGEVRPRPRSTSPVASGTSRHHPKADLDAAS